MEMGRNAKIFLGLFVACLIWGGTMTGFYLMQRGAKKKELYQPDTIKIASIRPLTGAFAETGKIQKKAMSFLINYLNKHGGCSNLGGAKYKIIFGDHKGDPAVAKRVAKRMITREHVFMLEGCYHSSCTKTASTVAEKNKVPFLNDDSTNPTLHKRGLDWFFRATPHAGTFCKQHAKYAKYLNKKYNASIHTYGVINEDTAWGKGAWKMWKKYFDKAGFELVKHVDYHAKTVTDLSPQVTKLKDADPDILLAACYVSDGIKFTSALDESGWLPRVLIGQDAGFVNPTFNEKNGDKDDGFMTRAIFAKDLIRKGTPLYKYNELYKQKFGRNLSSIEIRAFQGPLIIDYALEKATRKPVYSKQELRRRFCSVLRTMDWDVGNPHLICPYKGINFNEKGQNVEGSAVICQLDPQTDTWKTVYPEAYASTEPIIPLSEAQAG